MPTRKDTTTPQRVARVRTALPTWDVSGLLINSNKNRRWLSGFTGSAGWLLVTADEAILATDSRYWSQAEAEAPDFAVFRLDHETKIRDLLVQIAPATIGLEAGHLTLSAFKSLQKVEGIQWRPLEQTVEQWRVSKSAAEVEIIRTAAEITDLVMNRVPTLAKVGQQERELAWLLEKSLRENGADEIAFPVIVASGPNAALPHHRPGTRTLAAGDALIVDLGAGLNGYKSDLTRTFFLGKSAPQRFWQVYNLVLSAQMGALTDLTAGMSGKEADNLAREVIVAGGHGDDFGHGLGHGVGLDIHEDPRLSPAGKDKTVPAGSIVTIEPGVYLPGWGGVRLEDLVLVTEDGVELLSHCPKEPLIGE